VLVGFNVSGPVILLGSPEDNPLIKFLQAEKFLPYQAAPGVFPGPGRGYIAWQRDGVGRGQESVALIAHDEAGLAEAVGTFYEMVAGLEPLTRWVMPESDALTPAKSAPGLAKAAAVVWEARLPDRVDGIRVEKGALEVLTHEGSLTPVSAEGKAAAGKVLSAEEAEKLQKELAMPDPAAAAVAGKQMRGDRLFKLAAVGQGKAAVAYWGGTLRIADADGKVLTEQQMPQDVTALAWLGDRVVVGLADGRVLALAVK
jgi:hypothetical protein